MYIETYANSIQQVRIGLESTLPTYVHRPMHVTELPNDNFRNTIFSAFRFITPMIHKLRLRLKKSTQLNEKNTISHSSDGIRNE